MERGIGLGWVRLVWKLGSGGWEGEEGACRYQLVGVMIGGGSSITI